MELEKELELKLEDNESKDTDSKIAKSTIGSANQVAEIQQQVNRFDEVESFLLGNFNEEGKYEIPEEIVNELVLMKKNYLYAFTEVVFCESDYVFENFGKLQFSVKIERNQKDFMKATLYLEQDIKRAESMFKKSAVTELFTYAAQNSPSFINDCFEQFHIESKKDEGLTKKDHTEEEPVLVLAREKLLKERVEALDAQDVKYKDLLEKKLALLASYGFGKKIVEQFNLKKNKLNKYAKGYYRNLNNLLDQIMENNRALILNNPMFMALWGKLCAKSLSDISNSVFKPQFTEEMKPQEPAPAPVKKDEIEDKEVKSIRPDRRYGYGIYGPYGMGPYGRGHRFGDHPHKPGSRERGEGRSRRDYGQAYQEYIAPTIQGGSVDTTGISIPDIKSSDENSEWVEIFSRSRESEMEQDTKIDLHEDLELGNN